MVLVVQEFAYIAVLTVGLFVVGRVIRDYTTGIIGSLLTLILGLTILIDPVTGFSSLLNDAFGTVFIGFGAYGGIVGSLELLKK